MTSTVSCDVKLENTKKLFVLLFTIDPLFSGYIHIMLLSYLLKRGYLVYYSWALQEGHQIV